MKNRPMMRVNLDKAIARMAGEYPRMIVDILMSMANAIVGQLFPFNGKSGGELRRCAPALVHHFYMLGFVPKMW